MSARALALAVQLQRRTSLASLALLAPLLGPALRVWGLSYRDARALADELLEVERRLVNVQCDAFLAAPAGKRTEAAAEAGLALVPELLGLADRLVDAHDRATRWPS